MLRYEHYFTESDQEEILFALLDKCRSGEYHGVWSHRSGVKLRRRAWDDPELLTWKRAGQLVDKKMRVRQVQAHAIVESKPLRKISRSPRIDPPQQSARRKAYLLAVGRKEVNQ